MKKSLRTVIFGFTVFNSILFSSSYSQSPQLNFTHFSEADGLPSVVINTIYQDRLGYIWIGTINGLVRYDGYEFKLYTPDPGNYFAANINVVTAIYEDSKENLWIGYVRGVSKFNRIDETFTFFDLRSHAPGDDRELRVLDFCEDKNGRMWVACSEYYFRAIPNGLFYIDDTSNVIKQFKQNSDIEISNVNDFIVDDNNDIWFGSYSGLYQILAGGEKIQRYNSPSATESASVVQMQKGDQNTLWLTTFNQGLFRFKTDNKSFKKYLVRPPGLRVNEVVHLFSLTRDIAGFLWLWSSHGLWTFDPITEKFRLIPTNGNKHSSLQSENLSQIMTDRNGSIWLTTQDNGIYKYDPGKTIFRSYKQEQINPHGRQFGWVDIIYEDSQENLWISFNALYKFDRESNSFSSISLEYRTGITTLYQDKKKKLWIGGTYGLYYLDKKSQSIKLLDLPIPQSDLYIHSLYEDISGKLWLGTGNGIYILNQNKTDYHHIEFDAENIVRVAANQISYLIGEDGTDIVWVGTNSGLFKLDTKTYEYQKVGSDNPEVNDLISQDINSIYQDNSGIIWLGTWLGGLTRFDPVNNTFENYTTENGLASSAVQGILGDEENNALWLSTFDGISRFDLLTKKFKNYDVSDGIQGNQFADGAYFKTRRGEFVFGGANGFTIFTADEIKKDLDPPEVILSDFKLFNKTIIPDKNAPLSKPIYEAEEIILDHDENDISFDFLAMFFINPTKNKYAYMLENFEENWRYVGSQRTAVYPNLPPGKYRFRVKAANSDGVWSTKEADVMLEILPPWWKTFWAYIGYIIFALAVIFTFDRVQRRKILNTERTAATLREANLRAQIAESENERKTKELEEARELQLSMLPTELPRLPQLEISVYMKTATEVGGDYYDFSLADDGTLSVALGDATGHGMQAGTVVTLMKGLFTSDVSHIDTESFFNRSSKAIKQIKIGRLMMAFSLLKIKEKDVSISSAGMPPVYIFSKNSGKVEEILLKGMPLGALKDFQYTVIDRRLDSGDTILMLSDGLAEQKNDRGQMFDYQRIQELFQDAAGSTPDNIISQLVASGTEWMNGQEQEDDISLLVLKFK